MAYSGLTPYLGLRLITLKSDSWYSDMHVNLEKIDRLGRNFKPQARDGHRAAMAVALRDGTLVDVITVDPRADGSIRITLGRPEAADTISIAGAFLFSSLHLNNQNPLGYAQVLQLIAAYPANHLSRLILNPNQATETVMQFPNKELEPVPYLGSAYQLEASRSHIDGKVPFALTIETTVNGELSEFVIPAYLRD